MKTALLVIDMQNDYLCEKRKSRFSYDAPALTGAVNALIRRFADEGNDVIYIRHIIQDLPTNRLLFGYSIAGTEGAELYPGLEIVSDRCFDKLMGDALSNGDLRALIARQGYDCLYLCGLDECGCVAATAMGAKRRGLRAEILRSGTATVFPEKKVAATREKLRKAGISYR